MQSHQTMPPRRTIDVLAQMIPFGALGLLLACHGSDLTYNSGVPVITTQPVDQTVLANTTATFTVAATGNPIPTYTWSRYNKDKGWWNIAAFNVPSGIYAFTATPSDDQAQFRAIAFNSETSLANSGVVTLTVKSACVPGIGTTSGGSQEAGYWLNGSWSGFSAQPGGTVNALAVLGTSKYAAGYTGTAPKSPAYWQWNGSAWIPGPTLTSTGNGEVFSLVVDGLSHIYAAGYVTSAGVVTPTCWVDGVPDSNAGTTLALPAGANGGVATSVAFSGSDVYVGGYVTTSSPAARVPGYWKNGAWTALTPAASGYDSVVNALALSGSDVYAGGYGILDSSGVTKPGYWKNGTWTALAPLAAGHNGAVNGLLVLPGVNVYASGYSMDTSDIRQPGYWGNGTWYALSPNTAGKDAQGSGLIAQ